MSYQNEKLRNSISGLVYGLSGLYEIQSATKSALTAEIDRATSAENALTSRVKTIQDSIGAGGSVADNIAALSADLSALTQTVGTAEDTSSDATVYGAIAGLTDKIGTSSDEATDATVYGTIAAEAARAANIESELADNIDAVSTALTSEISRATLAEQNLADAISTINAQTIDGQEAIQVTGTSAKVISLTIKSTDKVLQQDDTGLIANIKLSALGSDDEAIANRYQLIGKNGEVLGDTIDIAKDQFLKDVNYIPSSKTLHFDFEVLSGTKTADLDISELVDTYTEGNGIDITNNVVSIELADYTESFLTVTEEGLALTGVQAAINAVSSDALTGLQAEIDRATDAEEALSTALTAEIERATNAERDNYNALTGLIDDEYDRATDAEEALSTALQAEINRATGAEEALSGEISGRFAYLNTELAPYLEQIEQLNAKIDTLK